MEKSRNPFALIVMAHLKGMETKGDIDNRLFWKITLVKRLYENGFSKMDILLLYKFIDWLLFLPDEVNKKFHGEITRFEEMKKMPYITTAERIGREKGTQDAVVEALEVRFKAVPGSLIKKIKNIEKGKALSSLLREAILANSLEEFEQVMNKISR